MLFDSGVRNPPAWHRVLPGPSGPEPQKSPKRVRKGALGPPVPGSPGVPEEWHCAPESEKSPKRVRSCIFGLFSDSGAHSLGTPGLPGARGPGAPFRTLLRFRARRAREHSVPGRGVPNSGVKNCTKNANDSDVLTSLSHCQHSHTHTHQNTYTYLPSCRLQRETWRR